MSYKNHKDTNFKLYKVNRNPLFASGMIDPVAAGSNSFLSNPGGGGFNSFLSNKVNNAEKPYLIKTEPKWLKTLVNYETGELKESNDLMSGVARKYAAVDKFVKAYSAPYQKRKVSLLFHTFTAVNMSNYEGIRRILDPIKYRYNIATGSLPLGYIWVLECSKGLHIHYHLAVAIPRFICSSIPQELKFNDLWGARTGVEFVKGDVGAYMQKKALGDYMSKHAHLYERYRVYKGSDANTATYMRMYGKSQKFVVPN